MVLFHPLICKMLPSQRSVLFAVRLEGSTSVALLAFFRLLGQSKTSVLYRNIGDNRFFLNCTICLPETAPVWLVSAVLIELNHKGLYRAYSLKREKSIVDSKMLLEVLVYAYLCGLYSRWKIQKACPVFLITVGRWEGAKSLYSGVVLHEKGCETREKFAQEDRTEGTKPAIVRRLWMT